MNITSMFGKKAPDLGPEDPSFLEKVINTFPEANGVLFQFFKKPKFEFVSLRQIALTFKNSVGKNDPDEFLSFARNLMTHDICVDAEIKTREQSKSPEWYELRWGRITASILYEAAKCKTFSGVLVEKIMGAYQFLETEPISRGKMLEPIVLTEVARRRDINVQKSGLILSKEYPMLGASPDGISENFVIEIKCPFKEKTVATYLQNGTISRRYWCQIQLQMLFANKSKGLFCVASPNFGENSEVEIVEVDLEKEGIEEILEAAIVFWKNAIYPLIVKY